MARTKLVIGTRKNLFDLRRTAVVHNLHVLAKMFTNTTEVCYSILITESVLEQGHRILVRIRAMLDWWDKILLCVGRRAIEQTGTLNWQNPQPRDLASTVRDIPGPPPQESL